MPNRSIHRRFETCGSRPDAREVAAAWIIAILLLLGTAVSVTFDHLVTVTDFPAPAGAGEQHDGGSPDGRELHDPDGAYSRLR